MQRLMAPLFETAGIADVAVPQHAGDIFDICCGAAWEGYNRVIA